jgi:LysM repeat protein
MSEREESSAEEPVFRCPQCDSVVAADAERCLMCGAVQPERPLPIPESSSDPKPEPDIEETVVSEPVESIVEEEPEPVEEEPDLPEPEPLPVAEPPDEEEVDGQEPAETTSQPVFVHVEDPEYAKEQEPADIKPVGMKTWAPPKSPKKKRSWSGLVYGITAVLIIFIVLLGIFTVQPPEAEAVNEQATIEVLLSPLATWTPQPSPPPTNTEPPPSTPTITLMPEPTNTLEPPREHTISSGDTLFGLALQYRISLESILEANEMTQNSPIIAGQTLLVPWPTPTPSLVPVGMEFNGELVIADPVDCRRYEIVAGDSLNAIAARADIDYDLFLLVNRLTSDSVIQPGDTVCIPEIVYGATLPPTAGPSPTPSLTPPPPGPSLLYPVQEAVIDPHDDLITLQWVAVRDLAEDEWYMVEVSDMDNLDAAPWRGFTRDNSFQVPSSWRPTVEEPHQMRWRVSLVKVTGFREDGLPLFTFGGQSSADAFFTWQGAIPMPTPTHTPTAMATPLPTVEPDEE